MNTIIQYVKSKHGSAAELLNGLDHTEGYLTNTYNWVSWDFSKKITLRLKEIFKDEDILYKVGLESYRLRTLGVIDHIARLMPGPEFILRFSTRYNYYFNKISELIVHRCARGQAIVEFRAKPGYYISPDDCNYTKGVLASLPEIWDLDFAKIKETQCATSIKDRKKINGKFYDVDNESKVHEYCSCEDMQSRVCGRVLGTAGSGGEFLINSTLYGTKSCVYHIYWNSDDSILKKVLYSIFKKPKLLRETVRFLEQENEIIESQYEELYQKNIELQKVYVNTISSLIAALEAKDGYTQKHSDNVCAYAHKISEAFCLPKKEEQMIENACRLHDLGKIGIPDSILLKPDKLTDEEWKEIKKHPVLGAEIIRPLVFLTDVAELIRQEHERFDGAGYPEGLKGENIILGARIIAVADAFDAMVTGRVYKKPMSKEEAVEEIKRNKGSQFDPLVVDIFVKLYEEGKV